MRKCEKMKKLKIMTIIGTRPEIIRLSEVIKKCDMYFEHILVHTGQNYDYCLNKAFFEDLNLRKPDYYLDVVGENLGQTIGNVISRSYDIMLKEKPDALLILGDTNSALAAISAKRLKIPVFHMEAGNRCFDENLPEETNRRIVDHIADVNMCYSEHARRYLNREGTAQERTYVTGSPMAEVLRKNLEKINKSDVLNRLGLQEKKYILLSAHREDNIDNIDNFNELVDSINKMAQFYNIPVIYSMHPRSKKYIEERKTEFHKLVRKMQPFNFTDYNKLQLGALCVVSDSGTLPEESAFYNNIGKTFSAVCIRTSTERPEALDKGCFILGGIDAESVLQSVDMAVRMCREGNLASAVPDYCEENVSDKVVRIIQSYVSIVNKMVWRK